ncbi:MAG: hypothetical protein O2800_03365 [Planctomycetota bacterium]|nr:hypothetical protein [Planctomycetota bacterium]
MNLTKFVGLLAGSAALTGVAQASTNDALAQIAELRAEIATLKASNNDQWLTEERANEIRGVVQDVLADADTRSSFQGANATSGYDNGFFISSADGNFRLNIGFLGQFNWEISDNGDDPADSDFSTPDFVVTFSGNVVDQTWSYVAEIARDENTNYAPLDGASTGFRQLTMSKDFGSGFSVTGGNFRAPFLRSSLLGDANQLGVGYSVVDDEFSKGYVMGANLGYQADKFSVNVAFANSDTGTNPGDVFARGEFLAAGDWAQFDKDVSFRGESFGLLVGGAYSYNTDDDTSNWTVDVTAMFGGFSVGGAYVYNDTDVTGLSVFGDYMISEDMDLYINWDDFGSDVLVTEDNDLEFGTNWYFNKTATRWTNQVAMPVESDDTDFVFSTQLQISF